MRLSDWLSAISLVIGRAPPVNQTLTLEPSPGSAASIQSRHFAAAEISIQERETEIKAADNIFLYKISETQYLGLRLGAGEAW